MSPITLLELVLALLAGAVLVTLLASRLTLPPAAALVVGGMVLAVVPGVPTLTIDPEFILVLFLPPLLMGSAYMASWRDFRADLRPILLLAVGAVAFTTAAVGIAAHLAAPALPWAACFTLGAIVSPPDAVAAKAVLERLRLPSRTVTILEGESLFNDATGLVLYRFAVAAALTGSFSAADAALTFAWLAVGGIAVGLAVGLLAIVVARRLKDPRIVVVVSFMAAWTSYLLAERLHGSGVLGAVACGLLVGWRQHEDLSAAARLQAGACWTVVTFVMEALIFVLIGLALRGVLDRLGNIMVTAALPLAAAAVAAAILSRFAWVFPGVYLPRLIPGLHRRDPAPPIAVPIVIGWAGMRGVVSLAVALALPVDFPGRELILVASFAVILVTVLVQGTTLGPLVRALGLVVPHGGVDRSRRRQAFLGEAETRVRTANAALAHLESLQSEADGTPLHPRLIEDYRTRVRIMTRLSTEGTALDGVRHLHRGAALAAIEAGRSELIRLHRAGEIHDEMLHAIEGEFDLEEMRLRRMMG